MGVTGLWTVVKPCARPIRLETLNKKRLAVDASIWIYQFLKAVRDKEGNSLRNAHIVGFFRRICKLLYFGIKPVFVFDGGAPELKRQTIAARRRRREGRREDASRTAERLLAIQLQKIAEEEATKSRGRNNHDDNEEPLPQELVYAEEALLPPKERARNRQFRKKDAYHLPDLEVSLEEMGATNDPRIMSHEELEEYAKLFHSGEVVNLYDFSKIDFDSPFFLSLPATDRYNILNAARLRSRLRMGYSKDQLDSMFPNRMEFSRFQIERVKERNDLTQRLMNLNGMNGDDTLYGLGTSQRIASERNREYVLVKDDSVEGGWALGVLGNKGEGREDKPIDVEQYDRSILPDIHDEGEDDEDAFEDVPIEGLNRLPRLPIFKPGVFDQSIQDQAREIAEKRQALYDSRKKTARRAAALMEDADENTLFVSNDTAEVDALFEEPREEAHSDDEALRQAIHMSLETHGADGSNLEAPVSQQEQEVQPTGSLQGYGLTEEAYESDDNGMDLFTELSKSKAPTKPPSEKKSSFPKFDGLLPFEPLKPRKQDKVTEPSTAADENSAGGFERESGQKRKAEQLPPWFTGDSQKKQFIEHEPEDQFSGVDQYRNAVQQRILSKDKPPEIIDLDGDEATSGIHPSSRREPSVARESPKTFSGPRSEVEQNTGNEVAVVLETLQSTADYSDSTSPPPVSLGNEEWPASDEDEKQRKSVSPSPEFEDVVVTQPVQKNIGGMHAEGDPHGQETRERDLSNDVHLDEGDYSDPEDAELMHQLSMEAEEHARFASTLNAKSQAENAYDYEQELKQLRSQQKRERRDADEVSHIMVTECQELLRLFGLPYITAPMEAEAQCAELVSLGLVDGVVTDDSDIFLFGGTRVYKNMFNQAKYVECYLASDLEKEYALDRQKLIRFAHLLGSDYTEGIPGVGPVTALEILTEFSTLEEFRDWWTQVQKGVEIPDDAHSTFRKKFKKKATKLFLPPSFPDKRVDMAYLHPEVDSDPSVFQWGVPDLNALRQFLMATVGWSQERTDEVLVPVIRDMNRREQEGTQANITNFYQGPQGAGAFAPRRRADGQTRMEKAFTRLRKQAEARRKHDGLHADTVDVSENESEGRRRAKKAKRTRKGKKRTADENEDSDKVDQGERHSTSL
ncbi:hypothetical protein VTO42DRAFT_5721 [Malbranchea cinnamomea]